MEVEVKIGKEMVNGNRARLCDIAEKRAAQIINNK